jgi:hypothetical protein
MSHLKVVALAILLVLMESINAGAAQRAGVRFLEVVRGPGMMTYCACAACHHPAGRTAALSSNGALSLWRNGSTSGDRTLADGKFAS